MTEQVTFQLRRGNSTGATGWSTINPVLVSGEPGFELDTTTLKIGDGSTTWNSLNKLRFGQQIAIGNEAGQSGQQPESVAIGSQAGQTGQQPESVAIGYQSGQTGQQMRSVAIGYQAGQTGQGGVIGSSVAIGNRAGQSGQGTYSVAIGIQAAQTGQGGSSVAIGNGAGFTGQNNQSVAIGNGAGGQNQQTFSVAIGNLAGYSNQGAYSIAIGHYAGYNPLDFYANQPTNSIILNASGSSLMGVSGQTGLYVAPIRLNTSVGSTYKQLQYNISTKEITYTDSTIGITGSTGIGVTFDGTTYTISSTTSAGIPANSILFSDGSGISGTTGFQYSNDGITLSKLNIQSSPYPATISIGYAAGQGSQGNYAVAIGLSSGQGQGEGSVAIGYGAGQTQQEQYAVAVGNNAGITGQKQRAVAIGQSAGNTEQGTNSVAVGDGAGYTGQGDYSVAIGPGAGYTEQGANSVAIGNRAGETGQAANTIILNASGADLSGNTGVTGCFYVKPIRADLTQITPLCYNSATGEIVVGSRTTTGNWTLSTGANTVSLTISSSGTYSIWVNGNIPNGIVVYTATVVLTNSNVPVIGNSYGWYYTGGGSPLVLTSIPNQVVGTLNAISTAGVTGLTASNVFSFGINNSSGSSQVVNWGYTKL